MLLTHNGEVLVELLGQPGCASSATGALELVRRHPVGAPICGAQRRLDEAQIDTHCASRVARFAGLHKMLQTAVAQVSESPVMAASHAESTSPSASSASTRPPVSRPARIARAVACSEDQRLSGSAAFRNSEYEVELGMRRCWSRRRSSTAAASPRSETTPQAMSYSLATCQPLVDSMPRRDHASASSSRQTLLSATGTSGSIAIRGSPLPDRALGTEKMKPDS